MRFIIFLFFINFFSLNAHEFLSPVEPSLVPLIPSAEAIISDCEDLKNTPQNPSIKNFGELPDDTIGYIIPFLENPKEIKELTFTFRMHLDLVEHLDLSHKELRKKDIQQIIKLFPKLKKVNLSKTKINRKNLKYFVFNLHYLNSINFSKSLSLTDKLLKAISKKPITFLCLNSCPHLTNKGLKFINQNVKELYISSYKKIDRESFEIILSKNISVLDLSFCHVNDKNLEYIAYECKRLEKIILNNCKYITNAGVTTLCKHLSSLFFVDLRGSFNVRDEEIKLFHQKTIYLPNGSILSTSSPLSEHADPL